MFGMRQRQSHPRRRLRRLHRMRNKSGVQLRGILGHQRRRKQLDKECAAHAETRSRLLLLESQREEQRKSLFQRATKFGKFAGNSILTFLTLILVGAALAGATITGTQIHNFWVASGVNVIIAAAAVWAILNAIFGVSILDLSRGLRTKMTASRYTTLCHNAGISAE